MISREVVKTMLLILHILAALGALFLISGVLWEVFETLVLPRRVSRRVRLTRLYIRSSWRGWSALACRVPAGGRRESALAVYGPLAFLLLLVVWAGLLIAGFALLQWALGSHVVAAVGGTNFWTDLYYSGTTFLTLGLGDVVPRSASAQIVTVAEVGTGFGLIALVIAYLPVLYQGFSRREVNMVLFDAHAGSPPTAGGLLRRHPPSRSATSLTVLLANWERWAADLLESHISYPLLAYYRAQHDSQSWVAALTAVLDTCALVLAADAEGVDADLLEQAYYTFVMARHAAVDLSQVFHRPPRPDGTPGRLPEADLARLREMLAEAGLPADGVIAGELDGKAGELATLRGLYEPYVVGLSEYLLMPLPGWVPRPGALDDWRTANDVLTLSIATRVG
jgi:hypothetical protein